MIIEFLYDDASPLHAPSEVTLNGQTRMVIYDENGNTTSLADMSDPMAVAERTLTWTDDNMPASVTHDTKGTTSFLYDGDGRRAKKSGAGGTTYYVNDLFEVKGGVETSYVFANGLRIAQVTATEKRFLHADHLGSTVAVTDEAGARVEGKKYLPYGLTRGTEDISGAGYQFTDQERDASTGLYNYDARLYDSVIGRFLSADPFVQEPLNPQSFNRYSYVFNNPLIYVDPSGYGCTYPGGAGIDPSTGNPVDLTTIADCDTCGDSSTGGSNTGDSTESTGYGPFSGNNSPAFSNFHGHDDKNSGGGRVYRTTGPLSYFPGMHYWDLSRTAFSHSNYD
jgi:RHS repeat-associated protein